MDSNGHYYLHNAHGDVVQLVDQNGTKLRTYRYDAFGNEKDANELDTNPFRYCGEYWDKETETLYLRNRNYDPRIGRFGAMDPVGDGTNWYTYCGGNPISFVDPLGLAKKSFANVVSKIVNAVIENIKSFSTGLKNTVQNLFYPKPKVVPGNTTETGVPAALTTAQAMWESTYGKDVPVDKYTGK